MPRPSPFRVFWRTVLTVLAVTLILPASAQEEPTLEEIVEAWLASPHADGTSEAFRHWDEDGEVPGSCAVCHTSAGLRDYASGPMETVGMIDDPVHLGSNVDCAVCHSSASASLQSVPFPSGVSVPVAGPSAVCTVCHQGRASTDTVAAAIQGIEDDAVSPDLGFVNPHYGLSAAILLGSTVRSGYEYAGLDYKGTFTHVSGLDSCTACHQPHSLEVALETCTTCHQGAEDFTAIRISPQDFDGDGDTTEGIADPIATLLGRLGEAIGVYAAEIAGTPVVYAEASYPYFFVDTDGDSAASEGEAAYPNRYATWTPRMLRAAYNYQYVRKNPGAYTHNPHYVLQLLHDSLQDLATQVELDVSGLVRP